MHDFSALTQLKKHVIITVSLQPVLRAGLINPDYWDILNALINLFEVLQEAVMPKRPSHRAAEAFFLFFHECWQVF